MTPDLLANNSAVFSGTAKRATANALAGTIGQTSNALVIGAGVAEKLKGAQDVPSSGTAFNSADRNSAPPLTEAPGLRLHF